MIFICKWKNFRLWHRTNGISTRYVFSFRTFFIIAFVFFVLFCNWIEKFHTIAIAVRCKFSIKPASSAIAMHASPRKQRQWGNWICLYRFSSRSFCKFIAKLFQQSSLKFESAVSETMVGHVVTNLTCRNTCSLTNFVIFGMHVHLSCFPRSIHNLTFVDNGKKLFSLGDDGNIFRAF